MNDASVNILIGGEAGQGLVTIGTLTASALTRGGYHIAVTQDYMSRIRGASASRVIWVCYSTYRLSASPSRVCVDITTNRRCAKAPGHRCATVPR